jgi:hypothetical protein
LLSRGGRGWGREIEVFTRDRFFRTRVVKKAHNF